MRRGLAILCALSFLVLAAATLWLGRLEAGGPPHLDLTLEGGLAATLYLPPGSAAIAELEGRAPEQARRPPAVVLAHGIVCDRATVSTLARRLASAGFAVLTPDLPGHGTSEPRFEPDPTAAANAEALAVAVAYLRTLPWVDGDRIAVAGHSMGATAAQRLAERESGLDATVLLSGARPLLGPWPPPNALFLVAERDPQRVHERVARVTEALVGRPLAEGERIGELREGTAVRRVVIPGHDHGSILWSEAAAGEIIAWLHAAFGRGGEPPRVASDPRLLALALALLALPLVWIGGGALAGRASIGSAPRSAGPSGLLALAGALLLTLPLAALTPPARLLGLVFADRIVGWLAFAGALLCAGILARGGRLGLGGPGLARSLAAGLLGFAVVYATALPLGVLVHQLAPTPERAFAALLAALLLLPFFLAFELLLRRGGGIVAALLGLLGRVLVLAFVLGAVALGVLPAVVALLLPAFAVVFLASELLALGLYASSRDPLAIAWADALVLGWILAISLPLA